jgi:hypothetical protein
VDGTLRRLQRSDLLLRSAMGRFCDSAYWQTQFKIRQATRSAIPCCTGDQLSVSQLDDGAAVPSSAKDRLPPGRGRLPVDESGAGAACRRSGKSHRGHGSGGALGAG